MHEWGDEDEAEEEDEEEWLDEETTSSGSIQRTIATYHRTSDRSAIAATQCHSARPNGANVVIAAYVSVMESRGNVTILCILLRSVWKHDRVRSLRIPHA